MTSDAGLRERVVRLYAREAQAYDDLWAPAINRVAVELLSALPPSRRVLDVATGTGTLLPDLRDRLRAELVVGVDLSAEMIALAPRRFGRAVADAVGLPFGTETFDLVVLAFVLFHLDDPRQAVVEAQRVLARGGHVATITWQSDTMTEASKAWNEELDRFGAPQVDVASNPEPVNAPDKMSSLLAGAGFEEVRAWSVESGEQLTAEEFIERRRRLGSPSQRLEMLDEATREACFEAACERVRRLPSDAFRSKWVLVFATARR